MRKILFTFKSFLILNITNRDATCEQSQVQSGLNLTGAINDLSQALQSQPESTRDTQSQSDSTSIQLDDTKKEIGNENTFLVSNNPIALNLEKYKIKKNTFKEEIQFNPSDTSTQLTGKLKSIDISNALTESPIFNSKKRNRDYQADVTSSSSTPNQKNMHELFNRTKANSNRKKNLNESELKEASVTIISDDEGDKKDSIIVEDKLDFQDEDEIELKKHKKKSKLKKLLASELTCLHCHKFICNLEDPIERSSRLPENCFNDVPADVRQSMNKLDQQQTHMIVLDSELNQISFKSNSCLQSYDFFKNDSHRIQINSFVDEAENNCWQYFTCLQCSNLIGFRLKFSNAKSANIFKYLNKIILISNL